MIIHPIKPIYNENSKVLILGSFPSVKSREQMFYYGHPQNRFWKVIANIFDEDVPESVEDKKRLILSHRLALSDVIGSCDIVGSSDSSIKNVSPNDLTVILKNAPIEKIFVNGRAAEKYFIRYQKPILGREATVLPSTSPANAAWSLERLIDEWKIIKD